MNSWGSGFITQIIYGALSTSESESFSIVTENQFDILVETGNNINT